jgi:hypothetical protein
MEGEMKPTTKLEKEPRPKKVREFSSWFAAFLFTVTFSVVIIISLNIYGRHLLNQAELDKEKTVLKMAAKAEKLLLNCKDQMNENCRQNEHEKLTAAITELQPKLDNILAKRIAKTIITECSSNSLDPALITGLIKVESGFNPFAESSQGALGLMQVRYSTWKEEPELINNGIPAKGALFWIDLNIKAGTDILHKYYLESDCDMVRALYRYNTGKTKLPKDIDRWDIRYVNKVLYYSYQVKTILTEDNKCDPEPGTSEVPEDESKQM